MVAGCRLRREELPSELLDHINGLIEFFQHDLPTEPDVIALADQVLSELDRREQDQLKTFAGLKSVRDLRLGGEWAWRDGGRVGQADDRHRRKAGEPTNPARLPPSAFWLLLGRLSL